MSSRSASVFTASRNLSDTCPQHHWRWNRLAQLVAHEHRQLGSGGQPADIAVEVETVEALHFQRDVPIKEFRDGCQFPDFTTKLGSVLVGLRSKTSLA